VTLVLLLALLLDGASGAPPAATQPLRPDPKLTPGVRNAEIAQANVKTTICVPGFTSKERKGEVETAAGDKGVTDSEKNAVYASYGITSRKPKEFEIDHLISLELGGANGQGNLWPQAYTRNDGNPFNAHAKDTLENRLNKLVCAGTLTLAAAQSCIADDWIACHKRIFPLVKK
jgi:hypothetical protein